MLGGVLRATPVEAQPATNGPESLPAEVTLTYDAPAGCPSRAEFEARLRARRHGRATVDSAGTPHRVQVHMERTGDLRATARVAITDAGGTPTTRRIVAASCTEAVDAAALVVALTLDPLSGEAPPDGAGPAAAEPPKSEQTKPGTEAEAMNQGTPGSASETAAAKAEPERRATSAPPGEETNEEHRQHASESALGARLLVAASGIVASGLAPDPSFGGQLAARVGFSRVPFRPSVRAGARIVLSDRVARPSGTAEFAWWAGLVGLCAGAEAALSVLVHGCATVELGQLSAEGSDTRNPASSRRLWAAAGPSLSGEWTLLPPLTLVLGVEALFPFRHQRFLLGTDLVHEVPVVAFRGEAGLGLEF